MRSVHSGYANVNGIRLYHEIYCEGGPLMLIHCGLASERCSDGWSR